MPYNANIPQATDQLSNSQPQILANFQSLAPFGNQTALFMTDTLAVTPVTAANQFAFFVNDDAASNPQIFIEPPSSGTPINITGSAQAAAGWSYLPSGILLKWGTTSATGQTAINFPVGATIPVFNTCLAVIVSVKSGLAGDTNQAIRVTTITSGATFNVYASNRTTTGAVFVPFTYFAIGF